MLNYNHSRFARTVILPVTLLSFLSACSKWSTVRDPVAQTLADEETREVRVTKTDGTQLIVHNPVVEENSLRGYRTDQLVSTRISTNDISEAEMLDPEPGTRAPRWLTLDPPFEVAIMESQPELIRVTRMNGRVIELESPSIQGSEVVGQARSARQVEIPLAEVSKMERQTEHVAGSVALVMAGAGVVMLGIVIAAMASYDP